MEKQFSEDSYFFNVQDAIEESKKDYNFYVGHPTIFGKQICYYNADKKIEDLPQNCIWVPLENFYNFFYTTKYRLPTKIVIFNDDFNSPLESQLLSKQLINILKLAITDREKLTNLYLQENKNSVPNFTDEKLRIFIPTSSYTTVMQYISKGIYDVLKVDTRYDVKLYIDDNKFDSIEPLSLLVEYNNFNPHIVININHILPFCNENVFNFIWFQDPMPFIMSTDTYNKKEKEYFFSLTYFYDKCLERKGIPFQRQNFAINDNIFKINDSIKREDKIVFIGSSYNNIIKPYNIAQNVIDELKEHLEKGFVFDDVYIKKILKKYEIDKDILIQKVIPYVVRDFSLIWLCESKLSKEFKIEVYGWGWEIYPQVASFYKGELSYGQALVDVYSSAKYTLASHSDYIIQQRVLEAISCGCQPILYDCREKDTAPYYEDTLIYYKSKNELLNSFNSSNIEKFEEFITKFTYKNFVEKILNIVENKKNE